MTNPSQRGLCGAARAQPDKHKTAHIKHNRVDFKTEHKIAKFGQTIITNCRKKKSINLKSPDMQPPQRYRPSGKTTQPVT